MRYFRLGLYSPFCFPVKSKMTHPIQRLLSTRFDDDEVVNLSLGQNMLQKHPWVDDDDDFDVDVVYERMFFR